jgi:hypothetical protein
MERRIRLFPKIEIRVDQIVLLVVLSSGLLLRFYFYSLNRSLHFDEALLGLNIVQHSFGELLQPLDYYQSAPLGFLWLEKIHAILFSPQDYVLRIVPLVTGSLALLMMYFVGKQYSRSFGIILLLILLAFSWKLIYYASELKQYSSDVFWAALLLFLFGNVVDSQAKGKNLILLGVGGVTAFWCSHPALFVLAAMGITLSLQIALDWKGRDRFVGLIAMGIVWGLNVIALYVISLRHYAGSDFLQTYWKDYFAPGITLDHLGWYSSNLLNMIQDPLGLAPNIVSVGLICLGAFSLAVRSRPHFLVLALTLLMTLAASSLKLYPFFGRFLLFLVPVMYLLIAEGMVYIWISLSKLNKPMVMIATILLIVGILYKPVQFVYRNVRAPSRGEHIKPVLSRLKRYYRETDVLYVYCGAKPAFEFYAPFYGLDAANPVYGIWARNEPEKYLADVDQLRGHERVWFLFSHNCFWCKVNEEAYIVEHLNQIGRLKKKFSGENSALYLFDLSP